MARPDREMILTIGPIAKAAIRENLGPLDRSVCGACGKNVPSHCQCQCTRLNEIIFPSKKLGIEISITRRRLNTVKDAGHPLKQRRALSARLTRDHCQSDGQQGLRGLVLCRQFIQPVVQRIKIIWHKIFPLNAAKTANDSQSQPTDTSGEP